jgi:hypothetical protein
LIGSAEDEIERLTPVSYGNCPLKRRLLSVKRTVFSTNRGVLVGVGVRDGVDVWLGVKVAVGVNVFVGV